MNFIAKKIRQALWVTLSCLLAGCIETGHGQPGEADHQQGAANELLWKISGNGLSKPSYLFGTFRTLEDLAVNSVLGGYQLVPKEVKAMSIGVSAIMDQVEQFFSGIAGIYEEGARVYMDSLEKKLGANQLTALQEKIAARFPDLKAEDVTWLPPGLARERLLLEATKEIRGHDGISQEMALEKSAEVAKVEVKAGIYARWNVVDKFEDAYSTLTYEKQIDVLSKMLERDDLLDVLRKNYHDRLAAYLAKDINKLATMERGWVAACPEEQILNEKLAEVMIKQLNGSWISMIRRNIAKKPTFFAINAAQLAGLIDLLREAGYTLTPMPTEGPAQ